MNQKYLFNLFFSLVLSTVAVLAESSMYGSGSSQNMVIQNKNTIAALKRQIAEQNERIDGLTSIIEGLSATLGELQGARGTSAGSGNDNIALLRELGTMIDKINNDYVSKTEFQKALQSKGKYTPSSSSAKKEESKPEESLKEKPASKLYSEGVRLFVKKRYDEAMKRFTLTDTKGYKPAASNYYLGEISYYTKKYEDAIFYYKKSAGLYEKASYMDILLLHTAVSLDKSGDKGQARIFYENVMENYQGKKSAKIAKERLKKL